MTPEDVGYCQTSLNFWYFLFVIILFICHYFVSVFCRIFPLRILFILIVTFVNLEKINPDFPNTKRLHTFHVSFFPPLLTYIKYDLTCEKERCLIKAYKDLNGSNDDGKK